LIQLPLPLLLGLIIIIPRLGQLFKIPMPLAAIGLGVLAAKYNLIEHAEDSIYLLSTLAITLLFLFAGLEADVRAFAADWKRLAVLSGTHVLLSVGLCGALMNFLGLPFGASALIAIGVLTPSAGFILDSLPSMNLNPSDMPRVRSFAILLEVASLFLLLFATRAESPVQFVGTVAALGTAALLLPVVWIKLRATLFKKVPRSEFVCLVLIAMLASYGSRELGMYYIFGAFFTGFIIAGLKVESLDEESIKYIHAIELITVLLLPLYFFHAGTGIDIKSVTTESLALAGVFLLAIPCRILPLFVAQRVVTKSPGKGIMSVVVALTPTLVFGLVMAEILMSNPRVPHWIPGGLVIYTLVATLFPTFLLRAQTSEMTPYHENTILSDQLTLDEHLDKEGAS
jgi:Kef-type K+ transport system membrane component KefB